MARQIADNLIYKAPLPLDSRAQFDTLEHMNEYNTDFVPEGFITYCLEDKKNYKYNGREWEEYKNDGDETFGYYTKLDYISDYAYEAHYNELNYAFAYKRFAEDKIPVMAGGCTAIRRNNEFARNLDWLYDNTAEFIIHTPAIGGRYATTCTCGQISKLSDEFVKSSKYAEEYILLPFFCVDGVNETGIFVSANVVPAEKGNTEDFIEPTGESRIEICANMIPRYILDNFDNALEAVNFIKEHARVYFSKKIKEKTKYELHFMVGDKNSTYCIEFVDNATVIMDFASSTVTRHPIMTNFHFTGITMGTPGIVPVPSNPGSEGVTGVGITPNASGLERYDYLETYYNDISELAVALQKVRFTRVYDYDTDFYVKLYSDLVGIPVTEGGSDYLTVDSSVADFETVYQRLHAKLSKRTRDKDDPDPDAFYGSWQTTHTVVYNLDNGKATFYFQEDYDTETEVPFEAGSGGDAKPCIINVKTSTALATYPEDDLFNGMKAYVLDSKKYYTWDSRNTATETGKWTEDMSGGGGLTFYNISWKVTPNWSDYAWKLKEDQTTKDLVADPYGAFMFENNVYIRSGFIPGKMLGGKECNFYVYENHIPTVTTWPTTSVAPVMASQTAYILICDVEGTGPATQKYRQVIAYRSAT